MCQVLWLNTGDVVMHETNASSQKERKTTKYSLRTINRDVLKCLGREERNSPPPSQHSLGEQAGFQQGCLWAGTLVLLEDNHIERLKDMEIAQLNLPSTCSSNCLTLRAEEVAMWRKQWHLPRPRDLKNCKTGARGSSWGCRGPGAAQEGLGPEEFKLDSKGSTEVPRNF